MVVYVCVYAMYMVGEGVKRWRREKIEREKMRDGYVSSKGGVEKRGKENKRRRETPRLRKDIYTQSRLLR